MNQNQIAAIIMNKLIYKIRKPAEMTDDGWGRWWAAEVRDIGGKRFHVEWSNKSKHFYVPKSRKVKQ